MPQEAHIFEHFVPTWWCFLWRLWNIWKASLAGRNTALGLGFEGLWSHPTFPNCFLGFLGEDENVIFQVPGPGCCHTFITIKDLLSENISQNKLLSWYLITATKTKPIQSPAEILPNSQQFYTNAKDLKSAK